MWSYCSHIEKVLHIRHKEWTGDIITISTYESEFFSIRDIRINIRKQQYIFVFSMLFIPFVLDKNKKNRNPVIRLVWQAKSAFFITCIKVQIRECVCETTYSITSVDLCKIRTIILIATLKLINDHWGLFLREKNI